MLGLALTIVSLILASLFAPTQLTSYTNKTVWNLTYFDPLRYASFLSFESWFSKSGVFNTYGSSIFDISTQYYARIVMQVDAPVRILSCTSKILDLFMPYVFSIVSIGVGLVLFKR
jgi:hypothetical protein